jgi:hypothetical protein
VNPSVKTRAFTVYGVTFMQSSGGMAWSNRLHTDADPVVAFEAARRGGLRPIEAKRVGGVTEVTLAQRPRGTTTAMTSCEV